jgi:hypothetical protein
VLALVCDHDSLSFGILLLQPSWNHDSRTKDANHSRPDVVRNCDAHSAYFILNG